MASQPWDKTQRAGLLSPVRGDIPPSLEEVPVAHTFTNILIHAIFSTKDRHPWFTAEIREEAFCYLGGTLNALGGQSVLVNGPADHIHMLFVQPRTLSIASVMEKVKANSSGWV